MTEMHDPHVVPPTPRTGPLRRRDFRLLFTGQAVSTLGDRLVMVAMPFVVLSIPGAGLTDVGLVLGASTLSLGLFVLVGGVWADRLPRHRTMLASDVVRGLAQAATAALLLTDNATVGALVGLQAVYGAAEAFFRPAALGLVPQLVEPDEVQPANALVALTDNISMIGGPVAAGLLLAWLGPGGAIAVDAATFIASGVALSLMRPRAVERTEERASFLTELRGGWREVTSRAWVWRVITTFTAYHFLVLPALFVLGPAFAVSDRGGSGDWAIISAGFGAGAVLGSLLALRWRPRRPGTVLVLALTVGATQSAVVVLPVATWLVTLLELVTGVAVALAFTFWETAVQQNVPEEAHSRVFSFDYLGSVVLMPLGYAAVGPAAAAFGTVQTAVACSVVTAALCVFTAVSPAVRRLASSPPRRA